MLVTCISDLHLGQSFNIGAFKDFLADQRKRVRPEMLVLAGDILELAWFSWKELEAQKLFRDSLDELRGFAASIETIYLPGNHDPRPKLIPDKLSPIRITPYDPHLGEALILGNILFTHGDHFDVTTHVWDDLLKLPLKKLLPWVYIKLYASPYEIKTAQKEKDFREYIGWIMGRAMMYSIRQGKDLCFGHTHAPMALDLGGRMILNSGDWLDSLSYIEARDGKMTLRFWRP